MKQASYRYDDGPYPWFVIVKFPYFKELKDEIKAIPGTEYMPESRAWRVPSEVVELVWMMCRKHGFELREER